MPERPAPTISTSTWSSGISVPFIASTRDHHRREGYQHRVEKVNFLSGQSTLCILRATMSTPLPTSEAAPRGRRAARASGDDRERAILSTAERLLEERPLGEISVEDLARGAGISRPTFYFYFPSKDAVLLTLVDRMVEAGTASREEALAKLAEDPRAGWRLALQASFEAFGSRRAGVLPAAELRTTNAEARELWARGMAGGVAAGAAGVGGAGGLGRRAPGGDRVRARPRRRARRSARPRPGDRPAADERAGAVRDLRRREPGPGRGRDPRRPGRRLGAGDLWRRARSLSQAPARSVRSRFEHLEGDSGLLQPRQQGVAHRLGGGDLAGARRELVEGEAERRLGQHLRGLAVARVAARDLGDDALAAALADELDLEPALGALGLARPFPRGFDLQQQLAGRRQRRQHGDRPHPGSQRRDRRQPLGDHVVAVSEVGAVAIERGGGAADDAAVDRRQRHHPATQLAVAPDAEPGRVDLTIGWPSLATAALLGGPDRLPGAGEAVDRRVVGAAGEAGVGADVAVDLQRHALRQLLDRERGAEVVGERGETAGVDAGSAGAPPRGGMLEPHPVDELGLAGEVDVVAAGRGAGGDERAAVEGVGTDGGDHDPGRLGDLRERGAIGRIGLDQVRHRRRRRSGGEPRANRFQLGSGAADPPPAPFLR